MKKRVIKGVLLSMIFLLFSSGSFASSSEKYTYNEAVNDALEKSDVVEELEDQLESLEESYDDLKEGMEIRMPLMTEDGPVMGPNGLYYTTIDRDLEEYNDFERLYEKSEDEDEVLTSIEEGLLYTYQQVYGSEPDLTKTEIFESFIQTRDLPLIELKSSINQLKNQIDVTPKSLESQVRALYDSILDLQNTLKFQLKYEEVLKKQMKDAEAKYNVGQISAIALEEKEVAYQKSVLNNNKLERQLMNLERQLKQLCGLSLDQEIVLSSNLYTFTVPELEAFDYYQKLALRNRVEVMNAREVYSTDLEEAELVQEYLTNELLSDRIKYDYELVDSKNALEKAKLDVSEDVQKAYFGMKDAIQKYNLKLDLHRKAKNDLNEKQEMFNKGLIDQATLEFVQFNYEIAKIEVLNASRDLNIQGMKLEEATSIGPSYETENDMMGGM